MKKQSLVERMKNIACDVKTKLGQPAFFYTFLSVISLMALLGILLTTKGEAWNRFFYWDPRDTGMDFYNSIGYVIGRVPYDKFRTLYPPLGNLFFLVLYAFIPRGITEAISTSYQNPQMAKLTYYDLRTYQSGFMIYVVLVTFVCVLMTLLVQAYFNRYKDVKCVPGVIISFVSSYGVLWAVERGNVIPLIMVFSLFFVCYYESDNKILRELALVSLAIAAGMKIYPALLGVVLLKKRENIWIAIRTIIYGILSLVLPCFAFQEGLGAIPEWLKSMGSFYGSTTLWVGNGINNAFAEVAYYIDMLFGGDLSESSYRTTAIAVGIMFVVFALFQEKKWQSILSITVAMMFQKQVDYMYCMMLIPLMFFIGEEKKLTKKNIVPLYLMMVTVLPFPLLYNIGSIAIRDTLEHIGLLAYFVWCTCQMISFLKLKRREEKPWRFADKFKKFSLENIMCGSIVIVLLFTMVIDYYSPREWTYKDGSADFPAMVAGDTYEQIFVIQEDKKLTSVQLRFATYFEGADNTLEYQFVDVENDEILAQQVVSTKDYWDNQFAGMYFEKPILVEAEKQYKIVVKALDIVPWQGITVYGVAHDLEDPYSYAVNLNGNYTGFELAMRFLWVK